jgi:hypothetical protein
LTIGASPAAAATNVFGYTGGEQAFVVPSGVHKLSVRLVGGSGGSGGAAGGAAADVLGDLEVSPGETLYVEVGGNGETGAGGFNGGAPAGSGGGGGGGASDIRLLPFSEGLSTDTRLAVAAGGGGGGGNGEEAGAEGGKAGNPGGISSGGNEGGGAGTASSGGSGGSGCGGSGAAGGMGAGGAGGAGESATNGGGGGGGGYRGGGGGGGGCLFGGGGGGGGSSLVPEGGLETEALGEPEVKISYTPPPTILVASPGANATYVQGQAITASYSCAGQEGVPLASCSGPIVNGATLDTISLGVHDFTVAAEDVKGGTRSATVHYTVVAPPSPAPAGSGKVPPPDTVLGVHPPKLLKTIKKTIKVKFSFASSSAGASFECQLDKTAFAACASPKRYKVKPGKHKFSVRALDGGGADPTPSVFKFKVKKQS